MVYGKTLKEIKNEKLASERGEVHKAANKMITADAPKEDKATKREAKKSKK